MSTATIRSCYIMRDEGETRREGTTWDGEGWRGTEGKDRRKERKREMVALSVGETIRGLLL